jgi:Big-like domain-containing protein
VLLLVDEPHSSAQDDRIVTWAQAIKAAQPAVRIWENPTYPDPDTARPRLLDAADVLAIKTWLMVKQGEAFADFFRRRGRQGQELALYGASGPARLVDPYTYQRVQAWRCADMGAAGSFFWSFSDDAAGQSWNEYGTTKAPYSPFFVSDGQVTISKHAQAIREGVEDFEYLAMLRLRLQAIHATDPNRPGLTEAGAFLDSAVAAVLHADGANDLQWDADKDRSAAERVRLAIASTLEALENGDASIGRAAPSIMLIGGTMAYDGERHPAVAAAIGAYGVLIPGSFAISYMPGGSAPPVYGGVYLVTAQFTSADPGYDNGLATQTITIVEPTSTRVSASADSAVFGQRVTFLASVAGAASTPAGSVQFYLDDEPVGGGVKLQNGYASVTIESLTPGEHVIAADYGGSDGFAAGRGTMVFGVRKATPLVVADGISAIYDGRPRPISASATGVEGIPVAGWFTIEYVPGGGSPPVDPGTYSASIVFNSEDPNYVNAAATTTVTITCAVDTKRKPATKPKKTHKKPECFPVP